MPGIMSKMRASSQAAPRCSFCGKPGDEVKKLIAGPSVHICNECIRICNEILADEKIDVAGEAAAEPPPAFHIGSFPCPKCGLVFDLHTRAPDDFIK
jgi:hypothetical protein